MGRGNTIKQRESRKPQRARPAKGAVTCSGLASGTLPAALTRCVGRERELANIRSYFAMEPGVPQRRLLTLIGAGGVGKTRLALEAGWDLQSSCADGAWLIELAALDDSAQIARVISTTLGLPMSGAGNAEDELVERLENQRALLIIDNCEHLLTACSRLIGRVLAGCPNVRVLATSQAMLRLPDETVLQVHSLEVPETDSEIDVRRVLRYGAVQLFVERARGVDLAFSLAKGNANVVVQICRRLDGIPLAIELAATALHHRSLQEIADGLSDRFNLLTHGRRAALPRHKTLRATLDWSYSLLPAQEQSLLIAMSVFAGGADEETITALAERLTDTGAMPELNPADTSGVLRALCDKGLLVSHKTGLAIRFHLLETMRDYGRELLAARGDWAKQISAAHAAVFIALAERAAAGLLTSEQFVWHKRLSAEIDNLNATLSWCDQTQGERFAGLRLATALGWSWILSSRLLEGVRWLERFLAHTDDRAGGESEAPMTAAYNRVRSEAQFFAGFLWWYMSDYTQAAPWLKRYVNLPADATVPATVLLARALVTVLAEKSRAITAQQAMHEIEALLPAVRATGDEWILGIVLARAGGTALSAKNAGKALVFYEESYGARKRAGFSCTLANASSNLGFAAIFARDYARARRHLEQAIHDARVYDNVEAGLSAKDNLAYIMFKQGQFNKVLSMAIASLKQLRRLGLRELIIGQLAAITYAGAAKGVTRSSAVLYGTVSRQMSHHHAILWELELESCNAVLAPIRDGLGSAEFESAWAEGESMSLDQAIDYAVSYAEALLPKSTGRV